MNLPKVPPACVKEINYTIYFHCYTVHVVELLNYYLSNRKLGGPEYQCGFLDKRKVCWPDRIGFPDSSARTLGTKLT